MDEETVKLEKLEQRVLSELMDFQRATVERIDYLYRHNQHRVLVCDEVGLGKTFVARGTVAKLAKLRREEGDNLFKVVYVCSNSTIADQNLQKLRISRDTQAYSSAYARLSMQHLHIFRQESEAADQNSFIQLLPLTPDTSFHMTSGKGIASERALMYAHLKRLPQLRNYLRELEVALMDNAAVTWKSWCKEEYLRQAEECNRLSGGEYFRFMDRELARELQQPWENGLTYLEGLKKLLVSIRRNFGRRVPETSILNQLRVVFAKISLERLEPDLVILDEFQRFKELLNPQPDTETALLTQKFFHADHVRMLLLSATPYKLYSTPEELDEGENDEHFQEFHAVMHFLFEGMPEENSFATVWKDYSLKLKELSMGDNSILLAKQAAEQAMYQAVCRTERTAAKGSADLMDDTDVRKSLEVTAADIRSYLQVQDLIRESVGRVRIPVDYVKSSPYLLSFMKEYQLKKLLERYYSDHPDEVRKAKKDALWLDRGRIDAYMPIPCNNARLERVMEKTLPEGMELLLWLPPSRPYYPLEGVFQGKELVSKTLVFSAWEMVPRMLASLLSYEAERRTVGQLARKDDDREAHYFHKKGRRYPSERMQFRVGEDGKPETMALLCLIYPSAFLAQCYDPIAGMNDGLALEEIRRQVQETISQELKRLPAPTEGREDPKWYYLAPLLLDQSTFVSQWLEHGASGETGEDNAEKNANRAYRIHLETLKRRFQRAVQMQFTELGKRPDDLTDLLTELAIASPAVCALRTYSRYQSEEETPEARQATELAIAFLRRMNTPEATAAVTIANQGTKVHWRKLLTYCVQGNLQALLDEYAHLLSNGVERDENTVSVLHRRMMEGLLLRTTIYNADTFPDFQRRVQGKSEQEDERRANLRTHFAVAFTKGQERESDTNRKKTVRNAFNSPFWPFVLATTSIGQEGLDFHNYCRRIVHWNLPSNPIDLEQREGRINRYRCLAIRQNVARRYAGVRICSDVWKELFECATESEKTEGCSDLIPNWCLQEQENMVKLERIVPMYPFSRDESAYERLMKILSLYRLTLGQARQEELLEYLLRSCDDAEKLKKLFIDLSPFSRWKEEDKEELKKGDSTVQAR